MMLKIHKRTFMQRLLSLLLTVFFLSIAGCSPSENAPEEDIATDKPEQPVQRGEKTEPPSGKRAYRTELRGSGEDVVTLMVYLCGSNLESQGGAATVDLSEMLGATISENLNIIVETGGANEWATEYIDPDANQRWQITNEDFVLLETLDAKNMSEGGTLRDFVTYSAENFPADRYMLLLWDHGGGTISGYANDERFSEHKMMTLPDFDTALAEAGVAFDMIGFDCCLMGTAETAFVAEKYADYMVASQRVEPGKGWYYTPWIDALSANTSIPTVDLCKIIVDDFIEENGDGHCGHELTLSVTDLTYIPSLFESMYQFFSKLQDNFASDGLFVQTSQAIGGSRAMQSDCDLVDMEYLLKSMDGSEEIQSKLRECIVYNGATIEDYNGLCLYIPYTELENVEDALDIYEKIGIDQRYQSFISTYANMMLGGQFFTGGGNNPYGSNAFDPDDWSELSWVDEILWDDFSDIYSDYSYDSDELVIIEKGDDYVLSLPDEDWDSITEVNLCVMLDSGDGYVDLGADGVYEFDDDGDLLIQYDYTWVALNGTLVCFYQEESDDDEEYWYSYGVVPVLYADKDAELVVVWDSDNPDGYVAGWRYTQFGGDTQRGLFELSDGMSFELIGDFYSYDFDFDGSYVYDTITINGPVTVSYEDVPDAESVVYYELYDIFQNVYYTESILYFD